MFLATWVFGFCATMAAIAICRVEARSVGTGGTEFDKPLRRALAFGLAIAALGLLVFYAMLGDGIPVPLAVLFGIALAMRAAMRLPLQRIGGLAMVLALIGFVCVIAAFQQVYGDYFFGFDDPFG